MKCQGNFIYKGVEKREGGEFVNSKGQNIKYDSKYVLLVDEIVEGKPYDRKFSISKNNTELVDTLKRLDIYSKITLDLDVAIYGTQVKLVPTAVSAYIEELDDLD